MSEVKINWDYDLLDVTESRASSRPGTPLDTAAALIGVDGGPTAGLSPFHGFRYVTQLLWGFSDAVGDPDNGSMADLAGITFRVDAVKYAYGVVYRVVSVSGDECKYRLKIRIGQSTTWLVDDDFGFGTGGLLGAAEPYNGEQFDVKVVGKFVYVFRSGLAPFVFYLEEDTGSPGTYNLIVGTALGPGLQPTLSIPTLHSFSSAMQGGLLSPDMEEVVTVLDEPATGDALARIIHCGFSNLSKVSLDSINFLTNPNLPVRNPPGVGGVVDEKCVGPSAVKDENDVLLWAAPPQPDPTFYQTSDTPVYPVPPGGPEDEFFGYGYDISNPGVSEPHGLTNTQEYVWAYRLYDTRTGRFSQLSQRAVGAGGTYASAAVIDLGASGRDLVTFPLFQIVYDTRRYDICILYRGIKQDNVATDQTILSTEATITLADYHQDVQPADPNWKRAGYFTTLFDDSLLVQETFQGDDTYLNDMPKAGCGYLYEGTMLFGNTGTLSTDIGGLGVALYSDLFKVSVELVPPTNRYLLQVPDEEVVRYAKAGPNVVGMTKRSLYLFRKFNFDLQGFPVQTDYNLVNPHAACEVGSDVYFLTSRGLKSMDHEGSIRAVQAINDIIVNQWQGTLGSVYMAFDAEMELLILHNPTREQTVLLWVETSKVTEVHDSVFKIVMEGDMPFDETIPESPLKARALFIQELEPSVSAPSTSWRIFTIDSDRRKANVRTLDPTHDSRFTVLSPYTIGGATMTVTGAMGLRLAGCYLYVMDGPHAGAKAKVEAGTLGVFTFSSLSNGLPSLPVGTRMGLSPIYFRWVGSQLDNGVRDPEGRSSRRHDYHTLRQAEQMSCSFTDVVDGVGGVGTTDARWAGLMYKGNEFFPMDTTRRFPIDPSGRGQAVVSVQDGPSELPASLGDDNHGLTGSVLFPSVEIVCPDLSFSLMSVMVTGKLLGSKRENRPITRRPT